PGTVAAGTPGTAPHPGTAAAGAATDGTGDAGSVVAATGQGAPAATAVPSSASVTTGSATPDKTEPVGHPASPTTAKAPGNKNRPVTPSTPSTPPIAAPAPDVKYVTVTKALLVLKDNTGRFYVTGAGMAGLAPDVDVEVVGPPLKNNKREVLGKARVK